MNQKEEVKKDSFLHNPPEVIKYIYKLCAIYGIFLILNILNNITSSKIEGDFTLYEKNESGTKLAKFRAKQLPPEQKKYIAEVEYGHDGTIKVGGGKRVAKLGALDVFGKASVTKNRRQELGGFVGLQFNF